MQCSTPSFSVHWFQNLSCSASVWLDIIGCAPAGQMEAKRWNKLSMLICTFGLGCRGERLCAFHYANVLACSFLLWPGNCFCLPSRRSSDPLKCTFKERASIWRGLKWKNTGVSFLVSLPHILSGMWWRNETGKQIEGGKVEVKGKKKMCVLTGNSVIGVKWVILASSNSLNSLITTAEREARHYHTWWNVHMHIL